MFEYPENIIKYTIVLPNRAVVTVREDHLYKTRWIEHFGGLENVLAFIEEQKKLKEKDGH
jgi:hypothetical protein